MAAEVVWIGEATARHLAAHGAAVVLGARRTDRIGPVADLDLVGWNRMVDVNVKGVLRGIAAALPVFRTQGSGHLVTVVSTSGLKIDPTQAVCAGTKNAVRTLLEAVRQESTDGVLRTTSISPGYVRTPVVTTEPVHDGGAVVPRVR